MVSIRLLLKALNWPKVLPLNPSLDVLRVILLKEPIAALQEQPDLIAELVDVVIGHIAWPQHPKNQMLAIKVLVNLFACSIQAQPMLVNCSEVYMYFVKSNIFFYVLAKRSLAA